MNRVFLRILSILILTFGYQAYSADFQGHNEFTHYDLEGTYRVTCVARGVETVFHQCRGYLLNPFNFGYFNHETDKSADRVELSTVNKEGKTIKKRSDWNQAKGRSKKRINLWVWTVFQRPLLEIGDNQVSYALTRRGQVMESGEFNVTVHDGGLRSCQSRSTTTTDKTLCENRSFACEDYFRQENNCDYGL